MLDLHHFRTTFFIFLSGRPGGQAPPNPPVHAIAFDYRARSLSPQFLSVPAASGGGGRGIPHFLSPIRYQYLFNIGVGYKILPLRILLGPTYIMYFGPLSTKTTFFKHFLDL